MNQKAILFAGALILSASTIGGCAQKAASPEEKAANLGRWQNSMMQISQAFSRLMPMVASPRAFNDPRNYEQITKDVKTLASTAHTIDMQKEKPSNDPSLNFVSSKFSSDMNEAVRQLDLDNRKFARFLIRNASSYCISCHTRNDQGRKDMNISLAADLSGLQPIERAEYHIAVRDYEMALKDFDSLIGSADAQIQSPQAVEAAAEKSLAVAVRVKRDPDLALKLVDKIMNEKWAPMYLKLNALAWKTALDEWKKEPKTKSSALAQAKKLMAKGWRFSANSPSSRAGLVYFLRASTLLHDRLGQASNTDYVESLYYAGLAAESLRELNLWTMHEAYYESCVRRQPYSVLAKKCYLRLEALQLAQYSDGDGAYIPAHIRDHLRELKNLAVKQEGDFLDWGFIE